MKVKILFVGDINSSHLQKWIRAMYKDFDLAVFSLDELHASSQLEDDIINKVDIYSTGKKQTDTKAKFKYLFNLKLLKQANREFKPDIVHAHYASSYGLLASLAKPKNLFVSVWGSDVFEFPKRSFIHNRTFRFVMRKADRIFSTSHVMKNEIGNYTEKRVDVVPFGVDPDVFKTQPQLESNSTFNVGTVKTLEDIYGIDRLIRAFALFHKKVPKSICHIYGTGSKENELRALAIELDVEKEVVFKGYVENRLVPDALNQLDVFCVLSRAESFGVAAVEASACELPVIASDVGGLPEVVLEGESGFIVNGDDIDSIVSHLITLESNPELRTRIGRKGREVVLEKYNWEKNVALMKSYYSE